jgi:hypothetical protein
MSRRERILTIIGILGLIIIGGFFIAKQAASEPHQFSTGLQLQTTISGGEDSKVLEAAYQAYIAAVIDVSWASASEECTGTPDFDLITNRVIKFLEETKDNQLNVTPAWILIGAAVRVSYPGCFAMTNEVGI